jgi:hypothetical protein
MEALLLTLDVACVILLIRNVLRVIKTENPEDLGIFRYKNPSPLDNSKKTTSGALPRA